MFPSPVRYALAALFVLACVTALAPAPATANVPSVGVVDMLLVTDSYARYAAARGRLEERKLELQAIVDEEEKSVLGLLEELEAVRATATQEEIMRRRREIEGRDRELREFVGQTNMQFREDLDTLQLRTRDEIETVVHLVARQRGLTLVLEKNMTLYTAETLDITAAVIAELNSRFRPLPAPASPPAARGVRPAAGTSATPAGGSGASSGARPAWSTPPVR